MPTATATVVCAGSCRLWWLVGSAAAGRQPAGVWCCSLHDWLDSSSSSGCSSCSSIRMVRAGGRSCWQIHRGWFVVWFWWLVTAGAGLCGCACAASVVCSFDLEHKRNCNLTSCVVPCISLPYLACEHLQFDLACGWRCACMRVCVWRCSLGGWKGHVAGLCASGVAWESVWWVCGACCAVFCSVVGEAAINHADAVDAALGQRIRI